MLRMHVTIAGHLLPDFLCRVRLAGHNPTVILSSKTEEGDLYVIVDLERINEIAARTLMGWLWANSGAASLAWNWDGAALRTSDQPLIIAGKSRAGTAV